MPQAELPDPDLIFEGLLRRKEFVPHPAGNSSFMFGCVIAFMNIISSPLSDPSVQLRNNGHSYPRQDQTRRRLDAERDALLPRPVSSVWEPPSEARHGSEQSRKGDAA